MEESSKRELLALKDIHLTGEASDKELAHRFVKSDIIADLEVGSFVLTHKGRKLLVRGSPALWDYAAQPI